MVICAEFTGCHLSFDRGVPSVNLEGYETILVSHGHSTLLYSGYLHAEKGCMAWPRGWQRETHLSLSEDSEPQLKPEEPARPGHPQGTCTPPGTAKSLRSHRQRRNNTARTFQTKRSDFSPLISPRQRIPPTSPDPPPAACPTSAGSWMSVLARCSSSSFTPATSPAFTAKNRACMGTRHRLGSAPRRSSSPMVSHLVLCLQGSV